MTVQVIRRGSLRPGLQVTLTARDEDTGVIGPVDLTTASSITAIGVQNGQAIIGRSVTGDANGVVNMSWETGDTDAVGYIHFRFRVVWPNGEPQTFPDETEDDVKVRVTLDGPVS